MVSQNVMCMFDLQLQVQSAVQSAIVAPIQIKHVHSSLSYQQATYQNTIGMVKNCLVGMGL